MRIVKILLLVCLKTVSLLFAGVTEAPKTHIVTLFISICLFLHISFFLTCLFFINIFIAKLLAIQYLII